MLFIDTPLVQDASADLPSFFDALDELPAPMRTIISVDDCAAAMTRGLARRSRRVYVPSWVALTVWLKPVLASRIMDTVHAGIARRHLDRVDAEVAALHRFTSARSVASGNLPAGSISEQ